MKPLSFVTISLFVVLPISNGYVQKQYAARYGNAYQVQQSNPPESNPFNQKELVSEGIGHLTSSLLNDIYTVAGKNFNIVLSPLSIWVMLAILLEGAGGRTEKELQNRLNMTAFGGEDGRRFLRAQYQKIINLMEGAKDQTEFSSLNYLIVNKKLPPEFLNIVNNFYDGKYFNFDEKRKGLFSIMVNNWAADKSNGKISNIMSPAMLNGLVMLIGNAVYFKAKWKQPFNPLDTLSLPFKDDNGEVIRSIPMMNMAAVLPLGYNSELDSQITELPYSDNKTSMIIILPHQKVGLRNVLQKMQKMNLRQIIPINMSEETVQISLPRFHVVGKMYLNEIFDHDLSSMFSPQHAEFPRMGNDVFVSRIYHKAEIENTEEGTTASADTSVQFAYKSSSAIFRADRPFVYIINDVESRTVLFAGTFSNPMTGSTKF